MKAEAAVVDDLWDDLVHSHEAHIAVCPTAEPLLPSQGYDAAVEAYAFAPTPSPPRHQCWGVHSAAAASQTDPGPLDQVSAAERLRFAEAALAREVECESTMMQAEVATFECQIKRLGLMHLIS